MQLTSQQLTVLKAWLDANAVGMNDEQAANALNATAPSYLVWRKTVTRSDVYNLTTTSGTTWDWSTYKGQSVTEQGAWTQMFMGDVGNVGLMNWRAGAGKIFTGSAPQNAQRDHIFAVGRRLCTVGEKLFVKAVSNPAANSGNDGVAGNRGTATNPDDLPSNFGNINTFTPTNVSEARNS